MNNILPKIFFTVISTAFLIVSCARLGTPSGGPKDVTPPVFMNSTPDTLATNVDIHTKELYLYFNEYITLKDQNKNIVISPPMDQSPIFSPSGTARKYVKVVILDTLIPNTTYSISFGKALQDNNQGNILEDFKYVFSTGEFLDSLEMNGSVSMSKETELAKDIVVALYKYNEEFNDSIILKQKPYYVTRVNDKGRFNLDYLASGRYKLIVFEDKVNNMKFDLGEEKMGFSSEIVNPEEDTGHHIQLFDQKPFYRALKAEQKGYGHIVLKVQGSPLRLTARSLDREFTTARQFFTTGSDSIDFWFNPSIDSITEKSERLRFLVNNGDRSDSLTVSYRNTEKGSFTLKESNTNKMAPGKIFKLRADIPIKSIDKEKISVKTDSIVLPFELFHNEEDPYSIDFKFNIELNKKYSITLNKEAVLNYFDIPNDSLAYNFNVGTKNDFGNLKLTIANAPQKPFWIQLLGDKDAVLEEIYVTGNRTVFDFNYLQPKEYLFRLMVDENENGVWDSGDFFQGRQPEKVYKYPEKVVVRALWDINETWVLSSEPAALEEETEEEPDAGEIEPEEENEG